MLDLCLLLYAANMAAPTPKPLTYGERNELERLVRLEKTAMLAGKPASAARLVALQARANIIAPEQVSGFPPPPPPSPPEWETRDATHIMRMEFDAEGGCTTYFEPRNLNSKNTSGVEIEIK
jgi:hypothetical protein